MIAMVGIGGAPVVEVGVRGTVRPQQGGRGEGQGSGRRALPAPVSWWW